jgi:hypothetical protein
MPGGDRTGPLGYGPMTGRGAGFCSGYGTPGYSNAGSGRGRGLGCGGRGWRNMYYAMGLPGWAQWYPADPARTGYKGPSYYGDFTPEREIEALKEQANFFQKQIETLNGHIKELEELTAKKLDSTK